SFYFINTTRTAPLADPSVRRALALAIDRRELVAYVTRGGEEPALALVPPGIEIGGGDFRQEGGAYLADGDAEGARRLLAEAGYPGGEGIPTLELLLPDSSDYRLVGEAVQEMWRRELGLDVTLVTQEWQSFFSTMMEGDFALAAVAWNADYIDPSSFLDVFLSQGGNNFSGWASSRYDELLAQARAALDPFDCRELYHRAEELLLAEMPAIPLFFPVRHYLQAEGLEGVFFTPLGIVDFKGAVIRSR
ncbi:MAG: ABC transporter substrate-binding protein, partial [bacterium]